jgi:hypothetical protein
MQERVTECEELGPICHRPDTRLKKPTVCRRGHVAPKYGSTGYCVVCSKLHAYEGLARRTGYVPGRPLLRRFTDYEQAREYHFQIGGYLLALDAGLYGCSEHPGTVERLRGRKWMARCDRVECWDEVELMARQSGGGNAD